VVVRSSRPIDIYVCAAPFSTSAAPHTAGAAWRAPRPGVSPSERQPNRKERDVAENDENRKAGVGDTPPAGNQGGEGNEGEGPAQGEQKPDDAPAPSDGAGESTEDDSDVEAVERGDAKDVGSRAEEVERAERREREAGEG
jgi:hypothetical protein